MDFTAFDAKELEAYAKEAKERWGGTPAYQEFQERAKGKPDFAQANRRLMDCFAQLGRVKDQDPASPEVQKLVEALRQTISENFYTCTPEILRGLGEMYAADPRFRENIDRAGGPVAAEFASRAIAAWRSLGFRESSAPALSKTRMAASCRWDASTTLEVLASSQLQQRFT